MDLGNTSDDDGSELEGSMEDALVDFEMEAMLGKLKL
jgi:hypothetical protein